MGHFAKGDQGFVLARSSFNETIDGRSGEWLFVLSTGGIFGWTFGGYWDPVPIVWEEPVPLESLLEDYISKDLLSRVSPKGQRWLAAYRCRALMESNAQDRLQRFMHVADYGTHAWFTWNFLIDQLKAGIYLATHYDSEEGGVNGSASILESLRKICHEDCESPSSFILRPPSRPILGWKGNVLPVYLLLLCEEEITSPSEKFILEAALEYKYPKELLQQQVCDEVRRRKIIYEFLTKGDTEQRRIAIQALQNQTRQKWDAPMRSVLETSLADSDAEVRKGALSLLCNTPDTTWDSARKYIVPALNDPIPEVRAHALKMVGIWGTPEDTIDAVLAHLTDPDPSTACQAAFALGVHKNPDRTLAYLAKALNTDEPGRGAASCAAIALSRPSYRGPGLEALSRAALGPNRDLSAQATAVLCQNDLLLRATPVVLDILEHGTPEAQAVAVQGLRASNDPTTRDALARVNMERARSEWELARAHWGVIKSITPNPMLSPNDRLKLVLAPEREIAVNIDGPRIWTMDEQGGHISWADPPTYDVTEYFLRRQDSAQVTLETLARELRVQGRAVFDKPGTYRIRVGQDWAPIFFEPAPDLVAGEDPRESR